MAGDRDTRARESEILRRLRAAEGYVSGTEVADALGISRNAVGKRVQSLRARGWEIEAVPNRGYRLISEPDAPQPLLVAPLLETRWLGRSYHFHEQLGSTNDEAAALAAQGAPHGTTVVADAQRAGRGRLGRAWHSPAGENLYVSMVLRPALRPTEAPPLSLAAGVGAAEALALLLGAPPAVKWPNDLLVGGRKIAGILVELSAELDRVRHVILGIGVNVNARRFPRALHGTATSLAEQLGRPVSRAVVLAELLASLERWIDALVADGPAPVIRAWLGYAPWLGQRITVRSGETTLAGVAIGLDASGALQLRGDDGRLRSVVAGEVTLG